MRGRRREPERKTGPSLEDTLQAEATEAAALAVVERLKLFLASNGDRKIRDLQMPHIKVLAGAAISGWVHKRAEQARDHPDVIDRLVHGHDPADPLDPTTDFLLS